MWKTLFAGAAVLCIVIVGGGYAYRQHEISAGIASYQKGDFQDAYSILHPFSGWGDPTAQGILADIDLKEKASSFFMSGSQRASANAGGTGGIGVENDQEALDLATDSAKAGNAFGEFVLSMIYMNGWSVNENDKEAFSWAQQSAQQGSALAAMELGTLYQFGTGVPQDSGQANTYFQQALAAGVWQADDLLGFNYASGEGVPQDAAKSVSYYQDAANHGDDTGEFNLGDDYLTGTGVTQDVTKAQPLLLAAAEQGNSGAMSDLGTIFSKGDASAGYPSPDLTLAYMFYDLAIANGDKGSAGDDKSQLAQSMTPDQVASGQAMASSWIKGKPFPSSSYEDFAAQAMYQAGHTDPSIIQNTNVWFSVSFTFEGKKLKVVFLKVKIPNGANSDGAKISIVTFDASKPPGLWYISKPIQLDYFETGMMGDVSINPDLSKSFDDPKRANVVTYC
jgi:TPR repeat protein